MTPDYTVVAVDAPAAEHITAALRAAGTGGTVCQAGRFHHHPSPTRRPAAARHDPAPGPAGSLRDGRDGAGAMGSVPDAGRHPVLLRHRIPAAPRTPVTNRHGVGAVVDQPALDCGRSDRFWTATATSRCSRSTSAISIPPPVTWSTSLAGARRPATARPTKSPQRCGARSFPRSRATSDNVAEADLPWPVWYALDRGLIMAAGPGQGRRPRGSQRDAVPGSHRRRLGQSARQRPVEPARHILDYRAAPRTGGSTDLEQRNVWQARHGGYQVHNNSVVFAGTWTKTFTRMTSMEAACESGRHAVNAILDHYIWVESGGVDRRENTTLGWRVSLRLPRSRLVESDSDAVTGR